MAPQGENLRKNMISYEKSDKIRQFAKNKYNYEK